MTVKKFQKLDKRHKGHEYFKYYVQIDAPVANYNSFRFNDLLSKVGTFLDMREQCWRAYGSGQELEIYLIAVLGEDTKEKLNEHYAWSMDARTGIYRIYLKSDAELAWLSLLW